MRSFLKSVRFALRGLRQAWKGEMNFRLQVAAGVIAVSLALVLGLSAERMIVLLLLITMVLVLELLNTFFEQLVDVLEPKVRGYVAELKDLLAAIVLVASIGTVVVGSVLFWPYLSPYIGFISVG